MMQRMKRLQISIEEELDARLAVEAAKRKTSKAAIIRQLVREMFGNKRVSDPMSALVGDIDEDAGDIDDVVYER